MKRRFDIASADGRRSVIVDAMSGGPATLGGEILVFVEESAAKTFAAILNVMNDRGNIIRVPEPTSPPRRKH